MIYCHMDPGSTASLYLEYRDSAGSKSPHTPKATRFPPGRRYIANIKAYIESGTSAYIGFNWVFNITGNLEDSSGAHTGPVEPELMLARDPMAERYRVRTGGLHNPIIAKGAAETWDAGAIYTANNALQVGNDVYLYYGGFSGDHGQE